MKLRPRKQEDDVNTERLLCATDGSPPSEKAVAYAVGLAEEMRRPITFLLVADGALETAPEMWDEARVKAQNLPPDKELLAALKAALERKLLNVKLVRAYGSDPAEAIVGYAERNGYHHIIVGSEGRTGAKRMLLGSVAEDVVTRAHCPVTVVR
ncbi:universal stress protein [Dongia deserti]|uniref:universal stress protein n=1 Tax=Dongia deserti TaxID=2268030 RepID=UPI000E650A85|nr:universal stress protein [Dongia deserti]